MNNFDYEKSKEIKHALLDSGTVVILYFSGGNGG